jgi:hypothetical protein
MAYSSGGLIQGADYNGFATSVNTLWGTGSGNNGYGQSGTALTTNFSSSSAAIAATDWATMISRMNLMRQHQTNGTTTGLSQPTATSIITYLSSLSSSITTLQTNKLSNGSQFQTAINPGTPPSSSTTWTTSAIITYTVTFSSGDAARYFFNQGGALSFTYGGTSLSGNSKSTFWNTLLTSGFGTWTLSANTSGYSGTGFTPTTNTTSNGYYNLTASPATFFKVFDNPSAFDYTANYIQVDVNSNGTNVSGNSDAGSVITVVLRAVDAAADTTGTFKTVAQFGDTVQGTTASQGYVYRPYTTYLTASYGTPTITGVVTSIA